MALVRSNRPQRRVRALRRSGALLAIGLWSVSAWATAPTLLVGTSGDYAPFSLERDGRLEGFDVAVARAYSQERGLDLKFVRFRWPELLTDLAAGRFELAMSGVTVRPERSVAGRFTVPVVQSGAVALVHIASGLDETASLDDPEVKLAVNAGGHLERVARQLFPRAQITAFSNNADVREAVLDGAFDAAVTDTLEAPFWLHETEELRMLGPFTRDRKAYLVRPDLGERAADLSAWLLEREADGTLARLRTRWLNAGNAPPTALALPALLAAVDERLDLMPLVAELKRSSGDPVHVPEQEDRVVVAASVAVADAARRLGVPAPRSDAVATLFRAQMAAAKEIQFAILAAPAPTESGAPMDLAALRQALLRIGDRIAELLVRLPSGLEEEQVHSLAQSGLDAPGLGALARDRIASGIIAVAASREPACPSGSRLWPACPSP